MKFNEFLGSLTAHFRPLESLLLVFGPVPVHLYVSKRTVYKTLRALKVKKSPGPELVLNIVWKEFAFELSPVVADIYNSSLEQGYVPVQLKQAIVVPVPKCHPPASVESDLRPVSLTLLSPYSCVFGTSWIVSSLLFREDPLRRPWFIFT